MTEPSMDSGRSASLVTDLIRRFRQNSFGAGMAALTGPTVLAATIGVVVTPILSRLYSPTEFGVFGVFAAALSLVVVISTLRYDWAIPAAPDDREAASILVVAIAAVAGTSIICGLLAATGVLGLLISEARDYSMMLAWALPLGMAAAGTYAAFSSWMIRRRNFSTLGRTKITQSVSMLGTQLALGVMGAGSVGLIIGQIAGSGAGIIRLGRQILKNDGSAFADLPSAHLRATATAYRNFPLLSGPAAFLDALTGALPLLVLASRFGAATAGQFTIVQRVIMAPLALLTTVMAQVLFGELAAIRRTNAATMQAVFSRRLRQIFMLTSLLVAMMVIVVPIALPVILGPRWDDATTYFLILSPMLLLNIVAAPFHAPLDILRRQDLHILRDTLRAFVMTIALTLSSLWHVGSLGTVSLVSAAGCLNGIIYLSISSYAVARMGQNSEHPNDPGTAIGGTTA